MAMMKISASFPHGMDAPVCLYFFSYYLAYSKNLAILTGFLQPLAINRRICNYNYKLVRENSKSPCNTQMHFADKKQENMEVVDLCKKSGDWEEQSEAEERKKEWYWIIRAGKYLT